MTDIPGDEFGLAMARRELRTFQQRPSNPLDWRLSRAEAHQLTSFIEDLLFTGHTPREVVQGIQEVWATEV